MPKEHWVQKGDKGVIWNSTGTALPGLLRGLEPNSF